MSIETANTIQAWLKDDPNSTAYTSKIDAIKALRAGSDLDLKEAKEALDGITRGDVTFIVGDPAMPIEKEVFIDLPAWHKRKAIYALEGNADATRWISAESLDEVQNGNLKVAVWVPLSMVREPGQERRK